MTMKTQRRLILIRHAKAVEDEQGGDHTRPLNARGVADAAALGAWLAEQGVMADAVLCSTATRTRETLEILGNSQPSAAQQGKVRYSDKLYLASAADILAQIQAVDDAATTLMVVGHNPGLHVLLAQLTEHYTHAEDEQRVTMKFPTAACAMLRMEADSWADVAAHSPTLEHLRWSVDG